MPSYYDREGLTGEEKARGDAMTPLEMLRYHVSGAIERGEAIAIEEVSATDDYKIDANGIIVSPGKFEGCDKNVPALWNEGLEGGAEDEFSGGYGFLLAAIGDTCKPCILTESDNGFIYAEYFDTVADYRKAIEECQNAEDYEA